MKTLKLLPAIALGTVALAISSSVLADTYVRHTYSYREANPINATANAVGGLFNGVGTAVGDVVGGAAYVTGNAVRGVGYVAGSTVRGAGYVAGSTVNGVAHGLHGSRYTTYHHVSHTTVVHHGYHRTR